MILPALLPIIGIIIIGFSLSRLPVSSPAGWLEIERFTYYIFFPSLLVLRLADSRFNWEELTNIAIVAVAALAILTILIVGLREFIANDIASMSSIYQGSIRFNTYIGLAVIDALFGDRGLSTAALCLAVYVPMVNILSVISLSLKGESGPKRVYIIVGSVVSNPLVIACVLGISLSYTNFTLPDLARSLLQILSQPALPLGLLAVGAGIRFISLGEQSWQLAIATVNKLLVLPGLVMLACIVMELNTLLATVLVLLAALPAPPSAYILARQLGGNESLMANIITTQTIAAFLMLPIWIELAGRYL
jgi:malonate transporter and related proteins